MLFDILALISLLIVIMLLRRLVNIYPSLMACLIRWKESINLEASVKLSRDRDMLAVAMIIPFCLSITRFGVYSPGFIENLNENARLGAIIGIFTAYILLRMATSYVFRPHKMNSKIYSTAEKAANTFFIVLSLLLLTAGGVLSFVETDTEVIKTAMIWISALTYALFLLRKTQIFSSSCNFFSAFLYLCALEIIPTGILVVPAVIF